jgi:hypothetical protein
VPTNDPEYQRRYGKSHYEANKAKYVKNAALRKAALKAEIDALKSTPCLDCGVGYPPYVMEFDHRPGEVKVGEVSKMVANNQRTKVFAEIPKCDIVCANCHRQRTYLRANVAQLAER